jgi:curli biogenesis system outer membrane secretion channel CsgG
VGCATTVTIPVQKTPTLNTGGIESIAVIPFTSQSGSNTIAQYATTIATANIQATGRFTLIDAQKVESLYRNNQRYEQFADAIFTGEITLVNEKNDSRQGEKKISKKETIQFTEYSREVSLEFTYKVIIARDGTILGPVLKRGKAVDVVRDNPNGVKSLETLAREIIEREMRSLARDIAPYETQEKRTLAEDDNKDLKKPMGEAHKHAQRKNYRGARSAYIDLYESHRSVAAAENASYMYEALNEVDEGADFMERVVNETGNERARHIHNRLDGERRHRVKFSESREMNTTEKVSSYAYEQIKSYLPSDSRLWVFRKARNERDLVSSVSDNLTSALLKDNYIVVDRQNSKLLEAERNFQMSGSVSDGDLVSIGNSAGVNKIIVLQVTGDGQNRRLRVQVLDVERGTVIMQSDTNDKWSI